MSRRLAVSVACGLLAIAAAPAATPPRTSAPQLPWYVTASAIHRVTLKPTTEFWCFEHLSMDPAEAEQQMLAWKSEGISALEVFAPEEGGNSYDGLDAKDRYRLDPGLGSNTDFRRLVALAHAQGLRVITFQNLGYSSTEATQFEAAEDAVRRGKTTRDTQLFYWSHDADALPPAPSNSFFFIRPDLPGYQPAKNEFWQWSDRAHAYYWTRWPGRDAEGNPIHLPQYNWSADAWPDEATRVVRFWMNAGLDGMVLDAVNWYAGASWHKINQHITHVIGSYGDDLIRPEGGGGFSDDSVAWVKDGHFTNIFDYGLGIWWDKSNQPLRTSVEAGNPSLLEQALRGYHDRVVAAGGTLYLPIPKMRNTEEQGFAKVLVAASGDMPCYCGAQGGIAAPAPGIPALLRLKAVHPALFQNSLRRRVPTDHDAQIYAIVRYAADDSERILLVFNFGAQPVEASVDLSAVDGARYVDLLSNTDQRVVGQKLRVSLAGHEYRFIKTEGYDRDQPPWF